jgi:peptidoglycan/LPS O-acetylase OafA/YrhL
MPYVWSFLAGALLCNSIPHLASGLQGLPFPTPFAQPRGVGNSSSLINVLWGFFNLASGVLLAARHLQMNALDGHAAAALAGALAIGIYLALHFGKVQQERGSPRAPRAG